mgnify:CR=1 FL=1
MLFRSKSSADFNTAVMTGEITIAFSDPPPAIGMLKSGKIRGLAVTANKRHSFWPDIPTMAEAGIKDMEVAERLGGDAGFGEKGLLIFCFVSDVEVCPLESEAIEGLIADEAWDAILNGGDDSAIGRAECGGISVGCERLSGTRCVPLSRLWVAVLGLFLGRHVGYLLNSGVRSLVGNSHLRVVGLASGVWVLLGDLSEFRVFV